MYATGISQNELRGQCTRFLSLKREATPGQRLRELAEYADRRGLGRDVYGSGEGLQAFEAHVAGMLGFEAGVFMPSGTMAQQIALRIWADQKGGRQIALHATSHLLANEENAYRHLHGLEATLLGEASRGVLARDVENLAPSTTGVLLELPMRRLGGWLPEWSELEQIKAHVRERGARLHLDGARLWECAPHYQRGYREICAGFDSVYVSFYKGLDAIAGAMLCGPKDFVAQARVWLRRHGGNLYQQTPLWISAQQGLEERLPRMQARYDKACSLARVLNGLAGDGGVSGLGGWKLRPAVPQSPMMHLMIEAPVDRLATVRDEIARTEKVWLASRFFAWTEELGGSAALANTTSVYELTVDDGTFEFSDEEAAALLKKFLHLAGNHRDRAI